MENWPAGRIRSGWAHILERGHNLLIYPPLERHDQFRQARQPLPAPARKLRGMLATPGTEDVDLALASLETQREPLLLLAAITAAPGGRHELGREIVGEPARGLLDQADVLD